MFKAIKKWWKYMSAKLSSSVEERADPKVQLEQAIAEAQDQHRRLREQAASVIANQKQAEMRLNRAIEELEKATSNTKQALTMAAGEESKGNASKAAEYNTAAESIATRLVRLDNEVAEQKQVVMQATQAADQAKAAVQQNAHALQTKLAERQKLLGQLDQAKMQEQMNKAMATLSEAMGTDVPTFDQVRDKIEARYAKAKGVAELSSSPIDLHTLAIEQARATDQTRAKLDELRAELGLGAKAPAEIEGPGESAP
jgi:phage shock protein A